MATGVELPQKHTKISRDNSNINKIDEQDRAFHDWYRFVLSYPPHLVRGYIEDFGLNEESVILDPFCGTGTTLVESKRQGIPSLGIEANPFAHFATSVKTDWRVDPDLLSSHSYAVAELALNILRQQGIEDSVPFAANVADLPLRQLSAEQNQLILAGSISPLPLHKVLVLLECLEKYKIEKVYRHQLLAIAHTLVFAVSNLRFGPEVGVAKAKVDAPVIRAWLTKIAEMVEDLRRVQDQEDTPAHVYLADARGPDKVLPPQSIDAVITSPPYPNEKDYTRTTRLESVILGFIKTKADLQTLKKGLIRSNTRNVYKADDDDRWIQDHPKIQAIAEVIERRRIQLGKTSGFEKRYSRVTKLYFGGMARHLAALRSLLRPNAQLAYVVGDQASYLRVMIPTGELLADIAQALGYELVRTDLFRTRFASATKEQLREEVVILRWKGACSQFRQAEGR
ncbi:MAG: DNA modification methyltransferase [Thermosynechococcus sp.]|uniref:DNA methyltransferase n=1 Tax=Thermosynechococcus sp. TaxID=2814275 RepID=UPI0022080EC0|nr:DNA methyltransferase [Thermosynechococcus sp.]BCX11254.1 MAG: DNA modification methyltransferase [Thermosynechococcus sp.]